MHRFFILFFIITNKCTININREFVDYYKKMTTDAPYLYQNIKIICLDLMRSEAILAYRGADKSLARPGREQATATEDSEFHTRVSYLQS
jgi:hypothetical protein